MQDQDYEYGDDDYYVPGECDGEEEVEWDEECEEEAGDDEGQEAPKVAKTKPITVKGNHQDEYDEAELNAADNVPEGDDRTWNNWAVKSFTPTGADTQWTQESTVEATEEVVAFPEGPYYASEVQGGLGEGDVYHDEDFPADSSSITGFATNDPEKFKSFGLEWKTLDELFENGYEVAGDKVSPTDVKQGYLGNCYFIGAMAAVAENKQRIQRIMLTKDGSCTSVHSVALSVCGIFEEVVIDTYIPYSSVYKVPAFTRSSKSQDVWVMLIEKAWAKIHGGYQNIEAGWATEALAALTGAPCHLYHVDDKNAEDNWKQMLDGERKNYIMCCGTKNFNKTGSDNMDAATGLCPTHAYTVLSAHEINVDGQAERLVKLRNPWGRGESKLAWNDNDPRWTADLKQKLQHSAEDDGTFFMRYSDWVGYFHSFTVCHYHDDYVLSSKKFLSSSTVPTALTITISTPGDYYFMMSQINQRMFPHTENYVYTALTMVIARNEEDGSSYTYVASVAKSKEQVWVKVKLAPGDYTAYMFTPWRRNVNQFGFGVYGPAAAEITLEDPAEYPEDFMQQMMIQRVEKNPATIKSHTDCKLSYLLAPESINVWYVANESKAFRLTATIALSGMVDMQFLSPHNGAEAVLDIQPGKSGVAIVIPTGHRATTSTSVSFKWNRL